MYSLVQSDFGLRCTSCGANIWRFYDGPSKYYVCDICEIMSVHGLHEKWSDRLTMVFLEGNVGSVRCPACLCNVFRKSIFDALRYKCISCDITFKGEK